MKIIKRTKKNQFNLMTFQMLTIYNELIPPIEMSV